MNVRTKCPHCLSELHRDFVRGGPEPGHFAACPACRVVSAFDENMQLRELTIQEMAALMRQPVKYMPTGNDPTRN